MIEAPKRPVMRYHGGKWLLADWIIRHFPKHRVYVEPFGGAGSVLLQKQRAEYSEVYNDLAGEVANVFRVLRDPVRAGELERLLRLTPFAREEFIDSYLPAPNDVEQARRTILRSFMGFGSASFNSKHATGFRGSGMRQGNPPAEDWANYPAQIARFTERLRGVTIEHIAALDIIARQDGPETLFYVDPPYPLSTRGNNKGVRNKYIHEMNDTDHRELGGVLRSLVGMVVVSGYPCTLYDKELYHDWRRVERPTFADGARPRTEVLWLNQALVDRLTTPLFE